MIHGCMCYEDLQTKLVLGISNEAAVNHFSEEKPLARYEDQYSC